MAWTAPQLNWEKVLKRKTAIVNKHTKGLEFLMKKNKVTVVPGYAAADWRGERWRAHGGA